VTGVPHTGETVSLLLRGSNKLVLDETDSSRNGPLPTRHVGPTLRNGAWYKDSSVRREGPTTSKAQIPSHPYPPPALRGVRCDQATATVTGCTPPAGEALALPFTDTTTEQHSTLGSGSAPPYTCA